MIRTGLILAIIIFVVLCAAWSATLDNYQAIRDEINAATN